MDHPALVMPTRTAELLRVHGYTCSDVSGMLFRLRFLGRQTWLSYVSPMCIYSMGFSRAVAAIILAASPPFLNSVPSASLATLALLSCSYFVRDFPMSIRRRQDSSGKGRGERNQRYFSACRW